MTGKITLEERLEALISSYEEIKKQDEYLNKQIAQSIKNKGRNLHSTPSTRPNLTVKKNKRITTLLLPQVRRNIWDQGETECLPPILKISK